MTQQTTADILSQRMNEISILSPKNRKKEMHRIETVINKRMKTKALSQTGTFALAKLLICSNNLNMAANELIYEEKRKGNAHDWLKKVAYHSDSILIDICKNFKDPKVLEQVKIELLDNKLTDQADAMYDAFLSLSVDDRDTVDDLITTFLQLPKHLQVDELKRMQGLLRLNSVRKVS
jgi:hypothetical protein